jgi:hypothetical protein
MTATFWPFASTTYCSAAPKGSPQSRLVCFSQYNRFSWLKSRHARTKREMYPSPPIRVEWWVERIRARRRGGGASRPLPHGPWMSPPSPLPKSVYSALSRPRVLVKPFSDPHILGRARSLSFFARRHCR